MIGRLVNSAPWSDTSLLGRFVISSPWSDTSLLGRFVISAALVRFRSIDCNELILPDPTQHLRRLRKRSAPSMTTNNFTDLNFPDNTLSTISN